MIWTIILLLGGFLLLKFFMAFSKDNSDLQSQSLNEKFSLIVSMINEEAFNGNGEVKIIDKREFSLYEMGENQIIKFLYGTGHLTIIWKYKYFQKEVIHERQFNNVRNLSLFEQKKLAEIIINEMRSVVDRHKANVLGDSNF